MPKTSILIQFMKILLIAIFVLIPLCWTQDAAVKLQYFGNLMDISKFGKIKNDDQVYLCESDLTNIAACDKSIDMVISRSVLEHVEYPIAVYREVHRVLKPGGTFIFLTPNKYDYASILATLIPNRFHAKIVKITEGRDEEDTFPTYYMFLILRIRTKQIKSG